MRLPAAGCDREVVTDPPMIGRRTADDVIRVHATNHPYEVIHAEALTITRLDFARAASPLPCHAGPQH